MTPRTSRLVRVPNLSTFRRSIVSLACEGPPLDARDRLVIVPTRAAAAQIVRSIEQERLPAGGAVVLPAFVLRSELCHRIAERLPQHAAPFSPAERHVLLGVGCRRATERGIEAPFRLRPRLVAEILQFYDTMRLNGKDVETFERLTLGTLAPDAETDRGAARLVAQTRFLVAAFREFEALCAAAGRADEHATRRHVLSAAASRPWRHIVITVGDQGSDLDGLFPADWDLVSRLPGLDRLDVVATEAMLAGGFHERLHERLPGIAEIRWDTTASAAPVLVRRPESRNPPSPGPWIARDREEEVAAFARWTRRLARSEGVVLDRIALVVSQPLPYVYLAQEVLRSAGVPCQTFDALPLAAEPFAAALDAVIACVNVNFSRATAIALLRSPHLGFSTLDGEGGRLLSLSEIAALDRALLDAGYLGDPDELARLLEAWRASGRGDSPAARAGRAAQVLADAAHELLPLRSPAPAALHLQLLRAFLARHERGPEPDDPLLARQLRARAAILATLTSLRDAYARFDSHEVSFEEVAGLIRRSIETQTFAPRAGDAGVHVVDVASARFGDFDAVYLAGLVEGEWPVRARRNIFYSPALLRELGWPPESDRVTAARNTFADLLRLPRERVVVSTFTFEQDAVVMPSTLLDEIERSGLQAVAGLPERVRIFEHEALALDPVDVQGVPLSVRPAAYRRLLNAGRDERRCRGATGGYAAAAWTLSALERYQDCPFRFFSSEVLRLEEMPDGDPLSPRARGTFLHEVFQRFFEAWDQRGDPTITPDRLDEARRLFGEVAEPLLARHSDADAALERTRLFGSAINVGIIDIVLGLEASRAAPVRERWLEHRFQGEFTLGAEDGRRVSLKGVADRVDLLAGRRLRVIDYKSGSAPGPRALQAPIYALCAQQELEARDGQAWRVDEAAYVAFSGKRSLVQVVKPGDNAAALVEARTRLLAAIDGIERGEFPPRPHDPIMCTYCSFASVCRKDYVGDDAAP